MFRLSPMNSQARPSNTWVHHTPTVTQSTFGYQNHNALAYGMSHQTAEPKSDICGAKLMAPSAMECLDLHPAKTTCDGMPTDHLDNSVYHTLGFFVRSKRWRGKRDIFVQRMLHSPFPYRRTGFALDGIATIQWLGRMVSVSAGKCTPPLLLWCRCRTTMELITLPQELCFCDNQRPGCFLQH